MFPVGRRLVHHAMRRQYHQHHHHQHSRRHQFSQQQQQQQSTLLACDRCGFVSRYQSVVSRHWRFCHSRPAADVPRCFTCDRCPWSADSVQDYVDHRRMKHSHHIAVYKRKRRQSSLSEKQDLAKRVSAVTDDARLTADGSMTSSTSVVETGSCFPRRVTSPPRVDDDERSLDENLRPMDGKIWLPDVDAGLSDAFQTMTKDWSTSKSAGQESSSFGAKPEVDERPMTSSVFPVGDEPLATSGGLFRCRYCRYTNAHKWKLASHMKASHAGRLVYRCQHCPSFVTDRRVEWCAHRSRHTGKTVFSCSECAYETTMKRNFERHLERHVAGGPRRCSICSYSSTGEGAIQRHMAEYHPPSPPPPTVTTASSPVNVPDDSTTPNSGGVVTDSGQLDVQSQTASSVLLIQSTKSSTPNGLTTVAATSMVKLPIISCDATGRWTCPLCPLSYKRPADLNRHMKQKHDVALKDFVVTRNPVAASTPPESRPAVLVSAPISKILESSVDISDQPLNLSLKESATTNWSKVDARVNLAVVEIQQTEPLDLSVVRPLSDLEAEGGVAERIVKTGYGYPCNQCSYVSKRASDLRRHQLVHCSNKRYRCPYCVGDRSYKLQFDLGRHMTKVHGKAGGPQHSTVVDTVQSKTIQTSTPFPPTRCSNGAATSTPGTTSRHIPPTGNGSSMACPQCQYVGKSLSELERHARLHSGEKPHRCPHCAYQTVWKSDLSRHVQKIHYDHISSPSADTGTESEFAKPEVDYNMNVEEVRKQCTVAVSRTTRIGNFIADIDRLRTGDEDKRTGGRCPLCSFSCDSPTVMTTHLESHETNGSRFMCTSCGQVFASRRDGTHHVALRHRDVPPAVNAELMIVEMKSGQPSSTSIARLPLTGGAPAAPVDVDALAEQYANEVTKMFYGSDVSTPLVSTPSAAAPTVRRFGVAIGCRSARADRCRPFKCSQCGRRSNWRWDLKKHIRASRHPNAEVIELSADEARRSFQTDISSMERPAPPTNKPYRCSRCGHRSNWKSDVTKHIRAQHPLARIVIMDDSEATATLSEYEVHVNSGKAGNTDSKSSSEEKELYTVDRQKLKRLRCSACPYRSNFRSDVGRHIRHKHRDAGSVTIAVMSAVEAAATLKDYMDMWTNKKSTAQSHVNDELSMESSAAVPATPADVQNLGKLNEVGGEKEKSENPAEDDDDSFEYVEAEDKSLPWKCAACDFIDQSKQAVVDHWQQRHCTQVKATDRPQTKPENDQPAYSVQYSSSTLPTDKKRVRSPGEKSLKCDICPYRTNKLGLLTIHKTYHRPQAKNTYKCPHCPYYVCASRLLHQHIRIHQDPSSDGVVRSASMELAEARNGSRHQDFKAAKSDVTTTLADHTDAVQFRCSTCSYVGRTRNDYIYHRQFHRARPTAPYRCQFCPYWVSEKRMLVQHQKVHQIASSAITNSSKPSSKEEQTVDAQVSMQAENKTTDRGTKYSQNLLTKTKPTEASLVAVRSSVEESSSSGSRRRRVVRTLWHCDRCPYVTAKRSQHESHRQLHGSQQRHTCRLCDYSVGGLHLLMQHVRLHHRQPSSDQNDTQPSQPAGNVEASQETIPPSSKSNAQETRPLFRCDRCPYSNSRRDHLLCHARFHSSGGPLRCPQCDYSVSKVHLLTQHLRVHQLSNDAQMIGPHATKESKDCFMRSLSLTTI